MAAHIGRPTLLVDITGGPGAVAAGLAEAMAELDCDLLVLLDVVFFDPVRAVSSAAPLATAVLPAGNLEEAHEALLGLGVSTELELERARARELDAGAPE